MLGQLMPKTNALCLRDVKVNQLEEFGAGIRSIHYSNTKDQVQEQSREAHIAYPPYQYSPPGTSCQLSHQQDG